MEWHDLPYKMEHFSAKDCCLVNAWFWCKKYRKTSVALEKLLHLFFSSMKKGKKLFQEDDGRDAFFFLATWPFPITMEDK